jgi:hypothetical protein
MNVYSSGLCVVPSPCGEGQGEANLYKFKSRADQKLMKTVTQIAKVYHEA